MRVDLHPEARSELRAAALWYEERRDGLGDKFVAAIAVTLQRIDQEVMARVRSLEGREAGILAAIVQGVFRLVLGRALNPTKVQAHASRVMLSSFLSNALLGSGRWAVGQNLVHMVRIRAAARNGCPF